MKKSKIIGWKNVFSFSFTQTAKSKSFIQSTVIMGLVLFLIMFGVNIYSAMSQKSEKEQSTLSESDGDKQGAAKKKDFAHTIYVLDDTGLGLSLDELQTYINKKYNEISLTAADQDHDGMVSEVEDGDSDVAFLSLSMDSSGMQIEVYLPKNTEYKESAADKFANSVKSYLNKWKDSYLGLTKEQSKFLSANITTTVTTAKHTSVIENIAGMYVPMFLCLVLYLFVILYGQMVGTSVATEKSSKVMELLLTSIRPLAIILGKVLSMMVLAITQFLILGVTAFAGNMVGAMLAGQMNANYSNILIDVLSECNLLTIFSPVRILAAFIVFLMGFAFYCTLAGLVGATVNRGEDLSSAMTVYSTISVVGFMLAYFPSIIGKMGNMKGLEAFAAIFPLSSPFYLPGKILTNDISVGLTIAGIAVLAIVMVLFIMVVAKVYEMVILYSGNKIGFKQIKQMFQNSDSEA